MRYTTVLPNTHYKYNVTHYYITQNTTQHTLLNNTHLVPGRPEHDHGRPDAQRRHRQAGHQHPVRLGELGVHPEDVALLLRDVPEDLVHALAGERDLLLLCVLVDVLPLGRHVEPEPPDVGLVAAAAAVALLLGHLLRVVGVLRPRRCSCPCTGRTRGSSACVAGPETRTLKNVSPLFMKTV